MLKKLKSLFVIEEDSPEEMLEKKLNPKKNTTTAKHVKSAPVKKVATSKQKQAREKVITKEGKVSNKFLNALLKAMDENNLEGFDYLEFKQSLQSLSKMTMDESTRYQSAFAMAQTMGATSDHLKDTASHYVSVLTEEEKKFKQALLNQRHKQIHDKEEEIKRLNKTILINQKQINKLNGEIESFKEKMSGLSSDLSSAESKLESTKSDFLVTYKKLVDQIQLDIEKMNQYLK